MTDETFVLDRDENPHPRLREHALMLRRAARATDDPIVGAAWLGYLDCMCDATGWNAETAHAWLDSHDDFDADAIGHKDAATPPAVAQCVAMPRRLGGPKDRPK